MLSESIGANFKTILNRLNDLEGVDFSPNLLSGTSKFGKEETVKISFGSHIKNTSVIFLNITFKKQYRLYTI